MIYSIIDPTEPAREIVTTERSGATRLRPEPWHGRKLTRFVRGREHPRGVVWFGARSFWGHLRHFVAAAIAMLLHLEGPAWLTPLLKFFFTVSYVVLAFAVGHLHGDVSHSEWGACESQFDQRGGEDLAGVSQGDGVSGGAGGEDAHRAAGAVSV